MLEHWLHPVFATVDASIKNTGSHALEYGLMGVSTVVALVGIGLAWALYRGPWRDVPGRLVAAWGGVHRTLWNKYYVDEAYNFLIIRPLIVGSRWIHRWIDAALIDGIGVNGPARLLSFIGGAGRRLAGGDVQSYAAALAIGLAILVIFVL